MRPPETWAIRSYLPYETRSPTTLFAKIGPKNRFPSLTAGPEPRRIGRDTTDPTRLDADAGREDDLDRSFEPLSEAEVRYLNEQLARARDLVLTFDPQAEGVRPTLESLDRAFENYLASADEPSDANQVVQAVGVVFGTELVEALGFQWVIATDEYGTDLAVLARPGRGDVTIFPVGFVAKRYECREAPFLVSALSETSQHLRKIEIEWGEAG